MKQANHFTQYKIEKICILLINLLLLAALFLVILPHLMMSSYNYASGDDWSFGTRIYHAIQNGQGITGYFSALGATVADSYQNLEARWANALFAALCPGNIREEYYHLNTWIFLAGLILSQLIFVPAVLQFDRNTNRYIRPITICMLILEILYVPYPTHSFYWWTGSVNYTFSFSLALIYFALLIGLVFRPLSIPKRYIYSFIATILGAFVAAGSFVVNVPMFIVSFSALAMAILLTMVDKNEKRSFLTPVSVFIPVLGFCISFLLVMKAPALQNQLQLRAGGETSHHLFSAILLSLGISLKQLFVNWMSLKVIAFMLLTIPFAIAATHKAENSYRFPALVSLFSFGLFASMISVEIYINGEIRTTYGVDVWYYAFYLLLLINEVYWIGWLSTKAFVIAIKVLLKEKHPERFGLIWSFLFGCLLMGLIYAKDLKNISSYQAINYVNNGWSAQYAAEWEARLAVLHDPDIPSPTFEPMSLYGGYITMYDFYEDDNVAYWINEAAADYYDKESIHLNK